MKKIPIKKGMSTRREIMAIQEKIMKAMPDEILFSKSKEELCAYTLNQFEFSALKIDSADPTTIEKGCEIILGRMGLMGISDPILKSVLKIEKRKSIDNFMYYLLEFDSLPGIHKMELEKQVNSDLDQINALIALDEKIEFISKKETPRNHTQRTQLDFYRRRIEEKVKIEDHLKSGIRERALKKASSSKLAGGLESLYEPYYDRPYRLPLPNSLEYFNHEMIDKVGHRIGEVLLPKGWELKKLYKVDKNAFYEELEKIIPVEKTLLQMLSSVKFLPYLPEQRKLIFDELVDLFKTKKWFGFYALAMTQVEGLFTDMCKLCIPDYNSSKAALPDKVGDVRPYHLHSENKFDYFQYHLPKLRNSFLHYGVDNSDSIEILCMDILYDLMETVSILGSLDIDANWFLRLIRKRDSTEFSRIDGICFYFRMLNSVKKQKQDHYFKTEIESLNKLVLPGSVFDLVFDLDTELQSTINRITPIIKYQSASEGFEVDLNKITDKTINENTKKIRKALSETIDWQLKSEFEFLIHVNYFFNSYSKYLDMDAIEDEVKNTIEVLRKKYLPILTKIKLIALKVDFKPRG